jgi:hypothetical protein
MLFAILLAVSLGCLFSPAEGLQAVSAVVIPCNRWDMFCISDTTCTYLVGVDRCDCGGVFCQASLSGNPTPVTPMPKRVTLSVTLPTVTTVSTKPSSTSQVTPTYNVLPTSTTSLPTSSVGTLTNTTYNLPVWSPPIWTSTTNGSRRGSSSHHSALWTGIYLLGGVIICVILGCIAGWLIKALGTKLV